jgi:hypothetical protein
MRTNAVRHFVGRRGVRLKRGFGQMTEPNRLETAIDFESKTNGACRCGQNDAEEPAIKKS